MKKFLPILIVIVVLAVALPTLARYRRVGLSEGRRAPDFSLQALDGSTVSLKDYAGKVVMVNFWSAACPPCRDEMPAMQAVYDELRDSGFTILAVNVNDSINTAANYVAENNLTFPVVMDDWQVSELYEVQYIPKTLFLDREGVIRFVHVGSLTEAEIRNIVTKWL